MSAFVSFLKIAQEVQDKGFKPSKDRPAPLHPIDQGISKTCKEYIRRRNLWKK